MTRRYASTESRRYPYAVATVEQLRAELADVDWLGISRSRAGWLCAWLPDPRRVVSWDEAVRIVSDSVA